MQRTVRKSPYRSSAFLSAVIILYIILWMAYGCGGSRAGVHRKGFTRKAGGAQKRTVPRNHDYRKHYRLNTNRLMAAIREWLGTPYCLGGDTKKCTDCSGFVKNVYKRVNGVKLPRTASKQHKLGKRISRSQLKPGDLVFFKTGRTGIHVGIYVGKNKFAHASTTVGVTITSMGDTYFKKRYIGAKRLF